MKRIRFTIDAPGAKKVMLVGDFTNWEARARPMRRAKSAGSTFSATVSLAPGAYQYKFIVDKHWLEDPKAHESVPNPFGTQNSVLRVSG